MKTLFILFVLVLSNTLFAQSDSSEDTKPINTTANYNDISSIGLDLYSFGLGRSDYVVNPNNSTLRYFAGCVYYSAIIMATSNAGIFLDLGAGLGSVDRELESSFSPDLATVLQGYLGFAYRPNFSEGLIFHAAAGINYLKIAGQNDDQSSSSSSGVKFTSNDLWSKFLNNYNSDPQRPTILGYPSFQRTAFALNLGVIYSWPSGLLFKMQYVPVFAKPMRNDFKFGFGLGFK
jgi:hypothetical protein